MFLMQSSLLGICCGKIYFELFDPNITLYFNLWLVEVF